jgi:hypothetical protein
LKYCGCQKIFYNKMTCFWVVGHILSMIHCLDRVVGPCLTFKHIVQHNWTSLWFSVIFISIRNADVT